jgi:hypothetical protein
MGLEMYNVVSKFIPTFTWKYKSYESALLVMHICVHVYISNIIEICVDYVCDDYMT